MITIREIAAIAGVSRSTVSLVLNNSPLVKAETREKSYFDYNALNQMRQRACFYCIVKTTG